MTELNNNQPPSQYPPQQPPPQPPPYVAPKKTHRFFKFVILPIVGLVALIVLAMALGSGGTPAGNAADPAGSGVAPLSKTDPHPVTLGAAFTLGNHRFDQGWQLEYDQVMGSDLSGSVTNVGKHAGAALFNVKFLRGSTVLANFQCSTSELEPGQSEVIQCLNEVTTTQRVTGWTRVTAETTY